VTQAEMCKPVCFRVRTRVARSSPFPEVCGDRHRWRFANCTSKPEIHVCRPRTVARRADLLSLVQWIFVRLLAHRHGSRWRRPALGIESNVPHSSAILQEALLPRSEVIFTDLTEQTS